MVEGREYTKPWRHPALYTWEVERMRNEMQIGQTVRAEIYIPWEGDATTSGRGRTEVQEVRILKKYPYIALTDKGALMWTEIALSNMNLIRKRRNESEYRYTDWTAY